MSSVSLTLAMIDGEGVLAVEEPLAAAGGGGDGLPLLDLEAVLREDILGLAEQHARALKDGGGQAQHGINEGGHIRVAGAGFGCSTESML